MPTPTPAGPPRPAPLNHTAPHRGRSSAVCKCCGTKSKPAALDLQGEPDLWFMPKGWSTAPFPANFRHTDGSKGSTYTCPGCNARLANGERLQLRATTAQVAS